MSERTIRRALISVYDKTGIVDFARALVEEFGIEIISTGGTAGLLKENDIPVTLVEEITGFPEMLDGRVKTLHPRIHAAILADRDNPEHMRQLAEQGIEPIDMVVVNLYPFEETIAKPDCTFEEAIEMIDIGGPCLLRAAAKNHRHVVVLCAPGLYADVLAVLRADSPISESQLLAWAESSFGWTSEYDDDVWGYLNKRVYPDDRYVKGRSPVDEGKVLPLSADWDGLQRSELRYGENPHQHGGLYEPIWGEWEGGVDTANLVLSDVLQGEMSFNNYLDANAAFEVCREVAREHAGRSVAVFVKHGNSCGVGIAADPIEAYGRAYLGDPLAAFGGVLAQSDRVDVELASAVMESLDRWGRAAGAQAFFAEAWVSPEFAPAAITAIRSGKKWGERVRLIPVVDMLKPPSPGEFDFRKITGGMIVQNRDLVGLNEDQWKVVTKREPTEGEMNDLRLAWLVCKHTKSNAVTVCRDGMLIGNGAGQMSRVMSCRIATWLAKENGHADKLPGSVAASDAFFPFRDGPDILIEAGVRAIIQPGGSKRDAETIAACDEREVAMLFTGTRHFKH
ncbi:MAG TPA: bifunctional phosphoribosylaminoimidazolecarboxamide formyltransferase/IMP cyclohydrolase [Phycisphaerae bacterium]|nr:bifunctional phosphoribosylaminoimidazolecarboxamide formyltransferase/IMP cyclohydrolase [Phycisphaerae bacterium]